MQSLAHPINRPFRTLGLFAALLLAGCASFSPDGGMDAVKAIAGGELNKEVVALRTPEEAAAARAETARLAQATADRGIGRADRAAQQSRLAGRV